MSVKEEDVAVEGNEDSNKEAACDGEELDAVGPSDSKGVSSSLERSMSGDSYGYLRHKNRERYL